MTYNDREGDQQQQQSCELYTFTAGLTVYRFTSYYTDIILDGNTYTHAAISRGSFSRDITGSIPQLAIQAPVIAPFSSYLASTPVEPTTFQLHKYFLYGASWAHVLMFTGSIKNVLVQDNVARVICMSKQYEQTNKIPRVLLQSYCNNELFDAVCGIDPDLWRITATITAITVSATGHQILAADEFDNVAPNDKGDLTGGYVNFVNDKRLILDHQTVAKTIELQSPFTGIVVTGIVTVLASCSKSPAECQSKFVNLDQFVGFPYIPAKTPVIYDR